MEGRQGHYFRSFFFLNYLSKSKTELVDLESIYIQGQILKQPVVYRKTILDRWDVEGKDHPPKCNFLLVDRFNSALSCISDCIIMSPRKCKKLYSNVRIMVKPLAIWFGW